MSRSPGIIVAAACLWLGFAVGAHAQDGRSSQQRPAAETSPNPNGASYADVPAPPDDGTEPTTHSPLRQQSSAATPPPSANVDSDGSEDDAARTGQDDKSVAGPLARLLSNPPALILMAAAVILIVGAILWALLTRRRPDENEVQIEDPLERRLRDLERRVGSLEQNARDRAAPLPRDLSRSEGGATQRDFELSPRPSSLDRRSEPKIVYPEERSARPDLASDSLTARESFFSRAARDTSNEIDAGPAPPSPPRHSAEAVLSAFNQLVSAHSPEALEKFAKAYGAVDLIQDGDGFSPSETQKDVWFVPTWAGSGEGLILPGHETVRTWEKFFRALGGERAKRVLGHAYDVESGAALEVLSPALARLTASGYQVIQRGRLQGV